MVKDTPWHAVSELGIGFVSPFSPDWLRSATRGSLFNPTRLQPCPATGITLFLRGALTVGGWPRIGFVSSFSVAAAVQPRPPAGTGPCRLRPHPRSSCTNTLIQLELTRKWLRFVISWLRAVIEGEGNEPPTSKSFASHRDGGLLGLASPREQKAQEQVARATRAMPSPRIKDISVIECQPAGVRLTVVKITTDQDGLYGYGCATFTQRADLVKPAVESYLKPFLLGKTTDRIEDIWQSCYDSSYWKNGPVLNNAISGIDQALWDIKGRQAGMPVYQLAGGKCREAADRYAHADGAEFEDVVENAEAFMAQGFRNVRVQVGVPGMAGYGAGAAARRRSKALHDKPLFEPAPTCAAR